MCDQPAWQTMTVDDYFYKYIRVSPILTYAESGSDLKKLHIQTLLLKKLEREEISVDHLKDIYKLIIDSASEAREEIAYMSFDLNKKLNDMKLQFKKKKDKLLDRVLEDLKS